MEILGKLLKLIAKQTDNKYEPDINSTLEDLGMDSLDVVELTMAVEEEFNIDIRDEVLDGIVTIGDLVKVVEKELWKTWIQQMLYHVGHQKTGGCFSTTF